MAEDAGTTTAATDTGAAATSSAVTKPDNVPEKFWDAEKGEVRVDDLTKSYTELERKQGKATANPNDLTTAAVTPTIEAAAKVNDILQACGLDPQDVGDQFSKHGELRASDYAALETKGKFPRGVVDQVLGMHMQLQEQTSAKVHQDAVGLVGGEEQLLNLRTWAAQNLTPAERTAYDTQVANPDTAKMAVEWLMAHHKQAVGAGQTEPIIEGEAATSTGGQYATQTEIRAAMGNPKYGTDRAFTADVDRRLAASESADDLPNR